MERKTVYNVKCYLMANNILVPISIESIQNALDAGIIQSHGTAKSADLRWDDVMRREYHFAQIVIAIILKEFHKQKSLPYNPK